MHLAQVDAAVTRERAGDGVFGRQAARHAVENRRAEVTVGDALRRHGADTRAHIGAARAHREGAGRDGDGERAGVAVMDDEGPGHAGASSGFEEPKLHGRSGHDPAPK